MGKFKEIFESTSADAFSSIALVIFVAVFLLVTVWVLTRKKKTVDRWASMPLHDDPDDIVDDRSQPKPQD
ncbi:CcoQ/FixQ family Cbb3-type cytochrome c oxidase assembly chaperone [Algisphaera agarilytica]|uniref:Cbb3-type cytochrome oxidase subunit 3 n=1 Tax=Algisphaera agarilytica TaxID=1385975 RepID=A0A7X0H921_9BACT|nr:CcoQ/FixQ family Cbb3-type cytochrome c oxidase assembly chaperone [Algisphaera agarilytica]MBB6431510.1 cbb3-type cytochrome oxidase subunit 3 [Algisphaera agarilytica]